MPNAEAAIAIGIAIIAALNQRFFKRSQKIWRVKARQNSSPSDNSEGDQTLQKTVCVKDYQHVDSVHFRSDSLSTQLLLRKISSVKDRQMRKLVFKVNMRNKCDRLLAVE